MNIDFACAESAAATKKKLTKVMKPKPTFDWILNNHFILASSLGSLLQGLYHLKALDKDRKDIKKEFGEDAKGSALTYIECTSMNMLIGIASLIVETEAHLSLLLDMKEEIQKKVVVRIGKDHIQEDLIWMNLKKGEEMLKKIKKDYRDICHASDFIKKQIEDVLEKQ